MKKKSIIIFGISIAAILCLAVTAFFIINSSQFKHQTAQIVSGQIESLLGNKIKMETIEVESVNSAVVNDIEIYDKQDELIAKADKVTISVNLWDIITQSPLAGISNVDIQTPKILLEQRDDGKWNIEDLLNTDSSEPVDFKGKVELLDGELTVRTAGKQITLEDINMTADCADLNAIEVDGSLKNNNADS